MISVNELQSAITLLKVIEVGGFAAAARELGVTQSTVSRRVAELEKRLGRKLVERTTRRLVITEAGQIYGEGARRLMQVLSEVEASLEDASALHGAPLRITAPSGYGRHIVLPVLQELARQHPDLILHVDLSDRQHDLLEEGYDLAVRMSADAANGMVSEFVANVNVHVCASPSYLHSHPVNAPEDIASHRVLVQKTYAPRTIWNLGSCGRTTEIEVTPRAILNDVEAVRDMALAGLGIAVLPDYLIARDMEDGRLVRVLPDILPKVMPVHLIWPRHKTGALRLKLARSYLHTALSGNAGFIEVE